MRFGFYGFQLLMSILSDRYSRFTQTHIISEDTRFALKVLVE